MPIRSVTTTASARRSRGGIAAGISRRIATRRRDCRIANLRRIRGWSLRQIAEDIGCSQRTVANVLRRGRLLREVPIAQRTALRVALVLPDTTPRPTDVATLRTRPKGPSIRRCPRPHCGGALYSAVTGSLRFGALSYDIVCLSCGRHPLPPRHLIIDDLPTTPSRGRPAKWS